MAILRRNPPSGEFIIPIEEFNISVKSMLINFERKISSSLVLEKAIHMIMLGSSLYGNTEENEVHAKSYETILDVIDNIPRFIEDIYNRKRLHSSLGNLPIEEFEDIYESNKEGRPKFELSW